MILPRGLGNTNIGDKYSQDLRVPGMTKGSVSDLKVGQKTVFVDEDGKTYVGLESWIRTDYEQIPTYIVDNHNYALQFWVETRLFANKPKYTLIHIDQHSDLGKPSMSFEQFISKSPKKLKYNILDYTNEICQVGNFIIPAMEIGIIQDQIQIRSEYSLMHFRQNDFWKKNTDLTNFKFILDIDVDFRDSQMGFESLDKTYAIVREIIRKLRPDCITIATSPYFMNQSEAIQIIQKILM